MRHRSLFVPVMGLLILFAWAALWVWDQSPYGRYINHAELGHLALDAEVGRALVQAAIYVVAWTLMVVAMMLPTTVPLIQIFQRMTRRRPDGTRLLLLLVAGYLAIWVAFGFVAHAADWALHRAVDHVAWLAANPWVFGAGPLLLAGGFQFSRLKYRCLDECRNPLGFVASHWRSGGGDRQAFRLGVHHGLFCVGCCWALMLLMFAVGLGSLGWMLVLAAVMAIEKNMPWGHRLAAPLGIALIAWGATIAVDHSWTWQAPHHHH